MEGTTMECPECQFENPQDVKFCVHCGNKLETICSKCGSSNSPAFNFCGECGYDLSKSTEPASLEANEHDTQFSESPPEETLPTRIPAEGERKHVTVLFSDLSGYTAMSERLDPEEVKEITSRIFGEISEIVDKYDGFIEKYAGDAMMALFGVPMAHEDDPIRAVKAAREIHELVDAVSPEVENRIGQPISMHTGINTGLVVTGEVNVARGTHGVAGDTINLASRLSNLAKPGEILIDVDTCRQAEGHFACEYLEETAVKGKADPVQVHKVLSQRDKPITIHRLSGLRADLVGRKVELAELSEAVENLREGRGRIFSICGAAGTGKSRLVEEFKATLDFEQIQWIEGHAYAYSQNIPYFPLIDLLNWVLHIEENDPPEKVREKVEFGIEHLVGKQEDVVPYVGGLYSLSYPEVEDVSPEFWKSRLQSAIKVILSALANKAPTIYLLEDLHWADPSFVNLLRQACLEIREPAIVLCVYRPTFSLFTGHQLSGVGKYYHEIQLQDLSRSEAQDMLESLLKTSNIPSGLKRLVQSKAEGNPFYLEELVNSLIESETLTRDNGHWRITKSISEADVSSSIHGLISGRLDRLDKETKRILQEASVIGRAFLYEILIKITELKDFIDGGLSTLERLDLIRTRALQPDLEYMFKHPLTQEVVYNGVLKKERQEIHEQIALVMEQLFQGRLPEFYETLAFHFKQGRSIHRAVDYLMKSGEKNLKRYAVEESHQYYKEAFDLLSAKPGKSKEEEGLLIDLLIKWAFVFYYLGDFKGLTDLLSDHKTLAESLDDKARLGMFYGWLGFALLSRGKNNDSYRYLCKALEIGEDVGNKQVVGYACTWLIWTCLVLGLYDDAIAYGERAQEISKFFESDHYLYLKSLGGLAHTYCYKGDRKKAFEAGKGLLEYGRRYSNNRSMFMGHIEMGFSHFISGDLPSAAEAAQRAITVSVDPFYSLGGRLLLVLSYVLSDRLREAEENVHEILNFSQKFGCEIWGTPALMSLGVITIAKGRMGEGLKMIEDARQLFLKSGNRYYLSRSESILGKIYLRMVEGAKPINLSMMAKNIGFLVKNVPFASKKAEDHFNKAIEVAKEIGAKGNLGEAYFDLGLLHKAKGRVDQARESISKAIQVFEECEADVFLKQANEALESLI
jgi:class 3 adenylate cyclase/tetratricopeptide (TPR) repeat protein